MWKAVLLLLLLLFATPLLAQPAHALSLTDNPVTNTAKKIIDWIVGGFKAIFNAIVDAVKGVIGSFVDGVKSFVSTLFSAITKPFTYLADAFKSSLGWLQSHLGPLAPLAYIGILAAAAIIIWYVVKYLVPGPIP